MSPTCKTLVQWALHLGIVHRKGEYKGRIPKLTNTASTMMQKVVSKTWKNSVLLHIQSFIQDPDPCHLIDLNDSIDTSNPVGLMGN